MKDEQISRIECAIRHIQSSLDVDPWAAEIATQAMKEQIRRLNEQCNMLPPIRRENETV